MTPTTTIATLTWEDFNSTPTTAEHVRNPRTAEVIAWLTERLDWEDRLDRLHERSAKEVNADVERA